MQSKAINQTFCKLYPGGKSLTIAQLVSTVTTQGKQNVSESHASMLTKSMVAHVTTKNVMD